MFDNEQLKLVAQEAFGKGDSSLTELTKTVAKAWKAVKEGAKTRSEAAEKVSLLRV